MRNPLLRETKVEARTICKSSTRIACDKCAFAVTTGTVHDGVTLTLPQARRLASGHTAEAHTFSSNVLFNVLFNKVNYLYFEDEDLFNIYCRHYMGRRRPFNGPGFYSAFYASPAASYRNELVRLKNVAQMDLDKKIASLALFDKELEAALANVRTGKNQ